MSDITTDFITATKRIFSKVATILTHIEVIEGDVKLIREQVIANADKPRTETQAQSPQEKDPNSIPASDSAQTERQKQTAKEENSNSFYRFLKRWWEELHKPKFQVAVLTLMGLIAYTCETHRTNNLTQKSLNLTRESMAGEIVLGDFDFNGAVVAGNQIVIHIPVTNVGHFPVTYGFEGMAFHWREMPGGDIPFVAPSPSIILETTKAGSITILDQTVPSEEFLYGIPHFPRDLSPNFATRHLGPPFPRPSVFFIGRLVYESLGRRTEKQFCSFLVYPDKPFDTILAVGKSDPRFAFYDCPKWNKTTQEDIE